MGRALNKTISSGFTLIELTIVMTILGLLLSLIGPMTIQSIEKAQAKSELLSVKNWLKNKSTSAYLEGQGIQVDVKGKSIMYKRASSQKVEIRKLDYLFFQPQTFNINSKGYIDLDELKGLYRNKPLTLNLKRIINKDYGNESSES